MFLQHDCTSQGDSRLKSDDHVLWQALTSPLQHWGGSEHMPKDSPEFRPPNCSFQSAGGKGNWGNFVFLFCLFSVTFLLLLLFSSLHLAIERG